MSFELQRLDNINNFHKFKLYLEAIIWANITHFQVWKNKVTLLKNTGKCVSDHTVSQPRGR